MVTVISLFAGCGGSSLGYKWAGFKELLAIDFEKNAVETFKLNFPEIPVWEKDIKQVTGKEILKFCKIKKGQLDILDGSPPCQGFSTAGKFNVNDIRNDLFKEYVRLINDLQPKVFIMENVSGMIKGKMKGKFIEIMKILKALNYQVKCKRLNSMWYNVPQSRERLIFIGVRNDLKLQPIFPEPNKSFITFKEAVKGCNGEMPPKLSKCFIEPVKKMKQGQSVADYIHNKHFQTERIFNNKVCPTITKIIGGIGFGALIHPAENRVLSISELKAVCSFPDNFKFIGKYQEQKARMGNAVMPKFMQAIAETIKNEIFTTFAPASTIKKL